MENLKIIISAGDVPINLSQEQWTVIKSAAISLAKELGMKESEVGIKNFFIGELVENAEE